MIEESTLWRLQVEVEVLRTLSYSLAAALPEEGRRKALAMFQKLGKAPYTGLTNLRADEGLQAFATQVRSDIEVHLQTMLD